MPRVALGDVSICYELEGEGDPLVLVHGSWVDRTTWDAPWGALVRTFRALRYDRRGHSEGDAPAGPGSVRDDARDLAALVERFAARPAHVVGNSLGGRIALELAATRPELVRSLVVHEPPAVRVLEGTASADAFLPMVDAVTTAAMARIEAGDAEGGAAMFVEATGGAWIRMPAAQRALFVRNARTWLDEQRDPDALRIDLARLADRWRGPTLLTRGALSPPIFAALLARVHAAIPHAETHVFELAGHTPHATHPAAWVDAVRAFLARA